jgi:hypothetical protein
MAIVRYRLDPNNPPELTREQVAHLDAMMPEEIERNAIEDAENPPSTDEELERGVAARCPSRPRAHWPDPLSARSMRRRSPIWVH